jgi:hypothetical protein
VEAAIEIGNAVERDLAGDLEERGAGGLRSGLERLAYDPPWDGKPASRAGRVW